MPATRISDNFLQWLKEFCQKNNLKSEQALDLILAKYLETKQPEIAPDIDNLNINQKGGAVQTYLRKREERLAQRKERIEEARQKAEFKVEAARKIAEIRKETENRKQFQKRYIRQGKPQVDWGNSQGAEPDWHEGYR